MATYEPVHGDLPEWAQKCHDTLIDLLRLVDEKREAAILRSHEAARRGRRDPGADAEAESWWRYRGPIVRDLSRIEMLRPLSIIVRD